MVRVLAFPNLRFQMGLANVYHVLNGSHGPRIYPDLFTGLIRAHVKL